MAPTIEIIVITAVSWGLKFFCFCKKVGYKSCVPCEIKFIIDIRIMRYKNNFQCFFIALPYSFQSVDRLTFQASVSFTLLLIKSVIKAGNPPRKNIARQPQTGKTK